MLHSRTDTPSPTTISHDVKEIYAITKDTVAKELRATKGKIHCGLDGWQSPNVISFLGVTVTRVVGAKIEEFILDFVKYAFRLFALSLAHCTLG